MRIRHAFVFAAALCLTSLMGCQSLDMGLLGGDPEIPAATPENPAVQSVCLWEVAEGVGLDGLPTRGFAGQIMFFTGTQPEPVKVDGDVRIYVFDDLGTFEEQKRPIHQFDFPSEVWNTYLRESNLGATYQMFIPYTRKGGYTSECVLRVRMTPENGLPVYSRLSSVHLAGRPVPDDAAAQDEPTDSQAVDLASGAPIGPGFDDLVMPIDSSTLQRATPPNTDGLGTVIADLLRESKVVDDAPETSNEPQSGRYNLSAQRRSRSQ